MNDDRMNNSASEADGGETHSAQHAAAHATRGDDGHLRYLLTAYLFENLSAEGRAEVEGHLAECDACRAELEDLRRTRALLEDAFGEAPSGYAFDERRRERVLAAAQKRHGVFFVLASSPLLKVAAVLLIAATLFLLTAPVLLVSNRARVASAPSEGVDFRGGGGTDLEYTVGFEAVDDGRRLDVGGGGKPILHLDENNTYSPNFVTGDQRTPRYLEEQVKSARDGMVVVGGSNEAGFSSLDVFDAPETTATPAEAPAKPAALPPAAPPAATSLELATPLITTATPAPATPAPSPASRPSRSATRASSAREVARAASPETAPVPEGEPFAWHTNTATPAGDAGVAAAAKDNKKAAAELAGPQDASTPSEPASSSALYGAGAIPDIVLAYGGEAKNKERAGRANEPTTYALGEPVTSEAAGEAPDVVVFHGRQVEQLEQQVRERYRQPVAPGETAASVAAAEDVLSRSVEDAIGIGGRDVVDARRDPSIQLGAVLVPGADATSDRSRMESVESRTVQLYDTDVASLGVDFGVPADGEKAQSRGTVTWDESGAMRQLGLQQAGQQQAQGQQRVPMVGDRPELGERFEGLGKERSVLRRVPELEAEEVEESLRRSGVAHGARREEKAEFAKAAEFDDALTEHFVDADGRVVGGIARGGQVVRSDNPKGSDLDDAARRAKRLEAVTPPIPEGRDLGATTNVDLPQDAAPVEELAESAAPERGESELPSAADWERVQGRGRRAAEGQPAQGPSQSTLQVRDANADFGDVATVLKLDTTDEVQGLVVVNDWADTARDSLAFKADSPESSASGEVEVDAYVRAGGATDERFAEDPTADKLDTLAAVRPDDFSVQGRSLSSRYGRDPGTGGGAGGGRYLGTDSGVDGWAYAKNFTTDFSLDPDTTSYTWGARSGKAPAVPPPAAVQENLLRSFFSYRERDAGLTLERFLERPLPVPPPQVGDEGLGQEEFRRVHGTNPFVDTSVDHLSTFSMDVDTASFTLARNTLRNGALPKRDAVRVEEFVNYFRQDYRPDPVEAFSVFCDGMPSVFGAPDVELLRVGIKARDLRPNERRSAVLTFAVDVSGSMAESAHLELVKKSLAMLVGRLEPSDRIAIVAYDNQASLILPHTLARHRERVIGAIESLAPRGGTNIEGGLELAYRVADEALSPGSVNRVMLFSDGVANIGARRPEDVLDQVRVFARRGIYLSVIGVGNRVHDRMLERLSNDGNGTYDFIRSGSEREAMQDAERIFGANLPSALEVLAEDAKIQVEFNPETVSHYRLLGYENRDIRDADFRNDKIDAAEVGPGTTVTVLYEIVRHPASMGPLGKVFLRFRDTATRQIVERDYPIPPGVLAGGVSEASFSLRHLAAVAEVAELLRASYYARDGSFANVLGYLFSFDDAERARPEWAELTEVTTDALKLTIQKLENEIANAK